MSVHIDCIVDNNVMIIDLLMPRLFYMPTADPREQKARGIAATQILNLQFLLAFLTPGGNICTPPSSRSRQLISTPN